LDLFGDRKTKDDIINQITNPKNQLQRGDKDVRAHYRMIKQKVHEYDSIAAANGEPVLTSKAIKELFTNSMGAEVASVIRRVINPIINYKDETSGEYKARDSTCNDVVDWILQEQNKFIDMAPIQVSKNMSSRGILGALAFNGNLSADEMNRWKLPIQAVATPTQYCGFCGAEGHYQLQCPDFMQVTQPDVVAAATRGFNCPICGDTSHRALDCPKVVCFTCSQEGHISARCPNKVNQHMVDPQRQTRMNQPPQNPQGQQQMSSPQNVHQNGQQHGQQQNPTRYNCARCHRPGHDIIFCKTPYCTRCKAVGHYSQKCPASGENTGNGGGKPRGDTPCRNCGMHNHNARTCSFRGKCGNCGIQGHKSHLCMKKKRQNNNRWDNRDQYRDNNRDNNRDQYHDNNRDNNRDQYRDNNRDNNRDQYRDNNRDNNRDQDRYNKNQDQDRDRNRDRYNNRYDDRDSDRDRDHTKGHAVIPTVAPAIQYVQVIPNHRVQPMMSSPERSWAVSQPSAQQQQQSSVQSQQGVQQHIEMRQPMQQQVNQNQTHTIHGPLNGTGGSVI
jgi:hypothetical protein